MVSTASPCTPCTRVDDVMIHAFKRYSTTLKEAFPDRADGA